MNRVEEGRIPLFSFLFEVSITTERLTASFLSKISEFELGATREARRATRDARHATRDPRGATHEAR